MAVFIWSIPEVLHAQGITKTLKENISFTLEKNGTVFNTTVASGEPLHDHLQYGELKPDTDWVGARDRSKSPLYLKNLDKIYYFEYLPTEKAVYVRHSQIQDDPSENIPTFYKTTVRIYRQERGGEISPRRAPEWRRQQL